MDRIRLISILILIEVCNAGRAAGDVETVARVRQEYPPVARRIEDVYSRIAISSRCSYFESGRFRSETMFSFIRDRSRFQLVSEMLTTHNQPFGARTALLVNDSYCFFARRPDPASTTILGAALPVTKQRVTAGLETCLDLMEPPPLNVYGFHGGRDWSYSFLQMLDLESAAPSAFPAPEPRRFPATLLDAETFHIADREFINLHCKTNVGDNAQFTLSPSEQWVVVAYRIERGENLLLGGKHEFDNTYKGVPLIKSCEYFAKWQPEGKGAFRETSLKAEVMFISADRQVSPALFDPEAIGVSFSAPAVEKNSELRWPWFLLVASILAMIAGVSLRRRLLQARSSQTQL
jgi:hypothetical protein